jgi:hypothetical protein
MLTKFINKHSQRILPHQAFYIILLFTLIFNKKLSHFKPTQLPLEKIKEICDICSQTSPRNVHPRNNLSSRHTCECQFLTHTTPTGHSWLNSKKSGEKQPLKSFLIVCWEFSVNWVVCVSGNFLAFFFQSVDFLVQFFEITWVFLDDMYVVF